MFMIVSYEKKKEREREIERERNNFPNLLQILQKHQNIRR